MECRICQKDFCTNEYFDRTCSEECKKKFDIEREKENERQRIKNNTHHCQYPTCKKEFYNETYGIKYCSGECEEKHTKEIAIENRERFICTVIPKKYHLIESDHKDTVNKYNGGSIFITGEVGAGKTVLMASIAKKIIRNTKSPLGQPIDWISYPSFIMELQNMFRKDFDYDEYGKKAKIQTTPFDVAEKIAKYEGVLCIDDIGSEKLTEYVRQITYFIINEREQRVLSTMITSNFSLAQIDEMIDSRISSRIAGMCETIKLVGKDRRLLKG